MTKRRRLVLGFAALGLLVTALTLMTFELDPPSPSLAFFVRPLSCLLA
jgi:hypothetical protein